MNVLLTGCTGYIGSHTLVELLDRSYNVIGIDNFSNSNEDVIENVKKITKKDFKFYYGDVCDKEILRRIFKENKIDVVIHFAGYKAVGESVKNPLMYYRNNIGSTLSLIEVMDEFKCYNLIFSSSATVYGKPKSLPIKENSSLGTTNPYGSTKLMIEYILKDLYNSNKNWNIVILRYFNPVGAHESGLIGENPNGIPNNLMPYIVKVASGEYDHLSIFGKDYNTSDGTGVRDYIHVVDLAIGHIKAIDDINNNCGLDIINLGTGHGYSVLDMVHTFEKVNNIKVPYEICARRDGDIDECYADCSYAKERINFVATRTLDDMCRSSYNYVKNKFDD